MDTNIQELVQQSEAFVKIRAKSWLLANIEVVEN